MAEVNRNRRHRPDQEASASDGSPHLSKKPKQKHSYPSRPPPAFWDNLSEIPLTRSALRELDRRNCEQAQLSLDGRLTLPACRPVARREAAEAQHAAEAADAWGDSDVAQQAVRRAARYGGLDLSELRGHSPPSLRPSPRMSAIKSILGRRKRGSISSSVKKSQVIPDIPDTATTRNTGPYDRAFQQHLIDFGIYPGGYEYPDSRVPSEPDNIEQLRAALLRRRRSLSPTRFSNEDFRKFQRADAHAAKEKQVVSSVIPIIEGDIGDLKCVAGDIPFTNLDHLTDGSLVPGNPDLYYGARPEQLNRRVREELSHRIGPSTQRDLPIAPNFFLAVKWRDGTPGVAQRRACYDGALGARGMQSLRLYGSAEAEPLYDETTRTITCTYHDGQLKIYATHPIQATAPEFRTEYVMTQVKAYALTSDVETFRHGAAAYRNARDWAKQQRDAAIKLANEKAARPDSSTLLGPALSRAAGKSDDTLEHVNEEMQTPQNRSLHVSFAPSADSNSSSDGFSIAPASKRLATQEGHGESCSSAAPQPACSAAVSPPDQPLAHGEEN